MEDDEKSDNIFFEVRCPGCKKMICESDHDIGNLRFLCNKCGRGRKTIIHLQQARKKNNIRKSDPLRVAA